MLYLAERTYISAAYSHQAEYPTLSAKMQLIAINQGAYNESGVNILAEANPMPECGAVPRAGRRIFVVSGASCAAPENLSP
jgi:hypothetical protein